YAQIGGDQQFLERVDRIGVDGPRTAFRLIRALNDLLEPIDNLLFGASEAFPDASQYAHQIDLNLRRVSRRADLQVSPSAAESRSAPSRVLAQREAGCDSASCRCGRSMSTSTAVRTSQRPSSTADICVAIGSSTPWRAPSASAADVVFTPSAIIFMLARISFKCRPRASSMPT